MSISPKTVLVLCFFAGQTWLRPVELATTVMSTLIGMAVRSGCDYAARRRQERFEWIEAQKRMPRSTRCTGCANCDGRSAKINLTHITNNLNIRIDARQGVPTMLAFPLVRTTVRYVPDSDLEEEEEEEEEQKEEEEEEEQKEEAEVEEQKEEAEVEKGIPALIPLPDNWPYAEAPETPVRPPTPFVFEGTMEKSMADLQPEDDADLWERLDVVDETKKKEKKRWFL